MWHWDQGRLAYFQFDTIKLISEYVLSHDFKKASRKELHEIIGLDFPAPDTHSPWRNYSRVLKLCLLVYEFQNKAIPTPVAEVLAKPGVVTCDEYLHFLLRTFTEPSPALKDWSPELQFRYPLLFSIKYLLAKSAIAADPISSLDEIIGAYCISSFRGDEEDTDFIQLFEKRKDFATSAKTVPDNLRRQARESLKVLAQISYLHIVGGEIIVTLNKEDAADIFQDLHPIRGIRAENSEQELLRLATLFRDGSTDIFFEFPRTVINDVVESGFAEGGKVKKTHITIERNSGIRNAYFASYPTTICDVCKLDTRRTYPWAERIMDIHHLLPLSSGTRVEASGTTFADLVPVCPSCHRAIHRFYDKWLSHNNKADFKNKDEALSVYREMKSIFPGHLYVD